MSWIFLATIGQLLNAVVAFLDKYIVSDENALPRPFVYAFYSCILTGFWGVIYFFGYIPGLTDLGMPSFSNAQSPTIQVIGMSFLASYTFFMALVSMYDALKRAEAVNVIPVIGAVSALATFAMSYLFLGTPLTVNFMCGVIVALHFVAMKGLFVETSFDDGFFWSRVSFVVFALSLLMVPSYYEKVFSQSKKTSKKTGVIVIATKVLAGVAAFLILKATDLGDVAVVQALDGLKFVFILAITIVFGTLLPDSAVSHEPRPKEVLRRVLYVAVIAVGYLILFL